MPTLIIDNPSNLPLVAVSELQPSQGDFKQEISERNLDRLMRSVLDHNVFIAKAIYWESGIPFTEDGHQLLKALAALRDRDYTDCEVVSYSMVDGRMQESERTRYDELMIPCQVIVPKGATEEERRKDAVRKLVQINSRYAEINPATTLFGETGFDVFDLDSLVNEAALDELLESVTLANADADVPEESFGDEMAATTDDNCLYPIIPKFSEKYDAILIISSNEIDTAFVKNVLGLGREQTYRGNGEVGQSSVISAERFTELWKSRS